MNIQTVLLNMEIVARGGGGGSGGSDGGGIFAIAYFIGYSVTSFFKKFTPHIVAAAIGGLVSLLFAAIFFRATWIALGMAIAGIVGAHNSYIGLAGKFRRNLKKAKKDLTQAAQLDSTWDATTITTRANDVFMRFQTDWQAKNVQNMQEYLSPGYYRHVVLMLYAMRQLGRDNIMTNTKIKETVITKVDDSTDNSQDRVYVAFGAGMKDRLIEAATQRVLFTDTKDFYEEWQFIRQNNVWLLDKIIPSTVNWGSTQHELELFAHQNDMFYSPDWGRLLLPTRGQLFNYKRFADVDVNNHVIGFWTGNLLVQLYTYTKYEGATVYLVGQLALPKSYCGILIRRRDSGGFFGNFQFTPSGYRKVQLEWGDFNKRYSVCATQADQVTSFELLNPSFMAWLYDQDIKVNIEVVDNVVYLYGSIKKINTANYAIMLEILRRAHRELKM